MLPKLTYTQRLIGFGVCMGLGYILSLMGTLMLLGGGPKAIRNFAALYVIGNIVALSGTGFLVGPQSQCKKMFHKCRRYACIFYLTMLAAVFVAAVAGAHVIIVLLLLIVQALAAVWYTASYIPYGRKFIVNTCCMPCKLTAIAIPINPTASSSLHAWVW
ncbi:unnamed protein product [Chrysoparadoxa australica]